jgi:putative (di)nucleoside polyphosphate hydrolase
LLRFEGRDRDIRLTKGTCEFSHWRWCPPHDIIVNAIAFKQPIYREILGIFAPLIAKTSIPADLPLAATRRRHIA